MYNAKSFAIAFLVSFFFLFFAKVSLRIFHHLLPRRSVTRIRLNPLGTLANILLVICLLLLPTRVSHDVLRALQKLVMVGLSEHTCIANVINVFHDVHSTSIQHKAEIFLKVFA